MSLLAVIILLIILYLVIYIGVLLVVDCDLGLLWAVYLGKSLSHLRGKVIWVTGASSGIGEFLAVEFAKHGAKVILSARSESNLNRVKGRCLEVGAPSDSITVLPFDVTNIAKHETIFQKAIKHFGKLDILVNNAGRSQRALWENIDYGVDKELFQLNVFSVVSLSRLAVKYFETAGIFGHLVVTSSMAGLYGVPGSATYSGSKYAIHGYFNSLRTEKLGSNLAVTLLCPGPVFSNLLPQCFTEKPGQVYGQDVSKGDAPGREMYKMQTNRCAFLSTVAIVNRLDEAWMGIFPVIPATYLFVYYPNIAKIVLKCVGNKRIMKVRDNRQTVNI